MLSTGVSLSFSSTEPKICSATSIEVKFPKSWRPIALCMSRSSGSSFHWFFERSSYFPSFFLALSCFFFFAPPPPRKKSKEQTNKQKQKKAKQTVNNHVKRWIWWIVRVIKGYGGITSVKWHLKGDYLYFTVVSPNSFDPPPRRWIMTTLPWWLNQHFIITQGI